MLLQMSTSVASVLRISCVFAHVYLCCSCVVLPLAYCLALSALSDFTNNEKRATLKICGHCLIVLLSHAGSSCHS